MPKEPEPLHAVPAAVLEATRSLFRLGSGADARRVTEVLIRGLGGVVVSAGTNDSSVLQTDVSFGDGEPVVPAAAAGSPARALLERYLTPFLLDARQALELVDRAERLAESASTDTLTGLPNRRMLERALGRLSLQDTVVMLDLDHFKLINDTLGHAAGDDVLRKFGAVLHGTVRSRDVVGRFGGEEFVVVLTPPAQAEAFLQRLRAEWFVQRPFPVTFSAGIARSAGDPDETMRLADEALYRAKDAGRDQWMWAAEQEPSSKQRPGDYVEPYLDEAVRGRRQPGVRLALDLLDNRVPTEQIVVNLLAAAQLEVGERWYRNELTAADEHLASGVTAAVLDALAGESTPPPPHGLTVVTCAEGDWHSLAANMLGEVLRAHGFGVRVLGASTPAEAVAEFLSRSGGDSLAISCSVPTFFPGVVRLVNAAHKLGVPVIVGGRAFGSDARRAERLGADAWSLTVESAAPILAGWQAAPPAIASAPTLLDPVALNLIAHADALGASALDALAAAFPATNSYDQRQLTRTREDLVFIVQFLAAALIADDVAVFTDFLTWLQNLLAHRGVPPQALSAGLDALRPHLESFGPAAGLLDTGRQHLIALPGTPSPRTSVARAENKTKGG